MYFQMIDTPGLAIHSFILGDEKSKQCLVVDPTRHIVPYIMNAQNKGFEITDILETHVHADFISGAVELKHALNLKPRIWCSGMGGSEWIPAYADVIVKEGKELHLGELHLKPLHTPGHTPEHVSWICYDDARSSKTPWFIFTGDCLFVGSVGRPDLLGMKQYPALAKELYHTLFTTLANFPDFIEIYPSHGSGSLCGKALNDRETSTLGYERLFNPYFQKEPEEAWIKKVGLDLSPIPPYFPKLKKINLSGPSLLATLNTFNWNQDSENKKLNELFLIDIRQPEMFAASHLLGSLNIPLGPSFTHWCGWMLPENTPLGFIAETPQAAAQAIDQVRLMGFDQDAYVIVMDPTHQKLTDQLTSFALVNAEELKKKLSSSDDIYILDVRTRAEWNAGHILNAHHTELVYLKDSMDHLPKEKPIALVCKSGSRASLAASLLEKNGFPTVMNLRGGMLAWRQAGLKTHITHQE